MIEATTKRITRVAGEGDDLFLYATMLRIRRIEEAIAERYPEEHMRCPVHLSVGQEACAAGVCAALDLEDSIFSTHRSHGHYLAKGGSLDAMIAELHGRETGCCGGRGGSMHLCDDRASVVASVPIVASNVPLAVGAALAERQRGGERISVAFLGDASAEEGVFHESLNFAATHALGVLFVLENNRYSVYTGLEDRQPMGRLTRFARAHGMGWAEADGSDVRDVYHHARDAVALIRRGEGPRLLVIDTYRYLEHCGPAADDHLGYRPPDEVEHWKSRCPIDRIARRLRAIGQLDDDKETFLREQIDQEIARAFKRAAQAPLPDPAGAADHVYAGSEAANHAGVA